MDLLESLANDFNWCKTYYETILEDSKCITGGLKIYIKEYCNSGELETFYKIIMKLLNKFYIKYQSYNNFKRIFDEEIYNLFCKAYYFETNFIEATIFSEDAKYNKLNRIYHNYMLWNTEIIPVSLLNHQLQKYHRLSVLHMFNSLVDNCMIDADEFYNLFKDDRLNSVCMHKNLFGSGFISYEEVKKSYTTNNTNDTNNRNDYNINNKNGYNLKTKQYV